MFVLTRRSALPRLQFVPGGLARFHDDRVTLIPLSTAQETVITAEPLSGGGYGVILNAGERASVVAQYPALRPARRQVRRLSGDAGGGWTGGLGRGLLTGALLLWVWFLFFLPGDPSARSAHRPAVGTVADDPAATVPTTADPPAAPSTADGPAFIDDPADQGRESATGTTETARRPGPAR